MNVYLAGLIAVCGILAIGIAIVVARLVQPGRSSGLLKVGLTVVLFATFYSIGVPRIDPIMTKSRVDTELAELIDSNVAFRALNTHAPEAIVRTREMFYGLADGEMSAAEMESRLREELTAAVGARIGKSSDEALINLIELTIDEVEWLRRRDDESCFALLFPGHGPTIKPSEVFSDELIERDLQSTAFILSTYDDTRPVPGESEASPLMEPIYAAAFEEFGVDAVRELGQPGAPGVDRKRMCDVTTFIYGKILALPDGDAATALRWMMN